MPQLGFSSDIVCLRKIRKASKWSRAPAAVACLLHQKTWSPRCLSPRCSFGRLPPLPPYRAPINSHPPAPEASCQPLDFTQTMVLPLPRSPTWAMPLAEVLQKVRAGPLATHLHTRWCSAAPARRQGKDRSRRTCWWSPRAEQPRHKEQVFPPLPFTHKSSPALTDEVCPYQSWTTS